MSAQLIDHSPDLKRLRDEGYDVAVTDGYLLLRDVPYVNARKEVLRGVLITNLVLANDVTSTPDSHVAIFAGEYPCDKNGAPIEQIRCNIHNATIAGLSTEFQFSAKPQPSGRYMNYYEKMSTYATILSGPAEALDASVTAKTHPVILDGSDQSVFKYVDTASSRADIVAVGKKIALKKVGIVGVGGTGSYVLDLIAKTPVEEIHIFDGDHFLQHNAFRAPGAPSGEELSEKLLKVSYLERIYSKMRRGIIPHPEFLRSENLGLLERLDFVFLCMEGEGKRLVVEKLEQLGTPFIDVGIGVYLRNETLGGIIRTTTSTPQMRDHVRARSRIPFSNGDQKNEYDKNIQIADLNALNAALAVIRWKKLYGFYFDQEQEHFSTYSIGGNDINNEDQNS